VVVVWAKLAGMNSVLAVSEWAKDQEAAIRNGAGLRWKRMPCANTYSYVLAHLDSQLVNAHLAAWFVRQMAPTQAEERDERHVHLAIDGKTLKSTGEQAYGGEHPQQQVLHIYEAETGVVLQQIPIGTKTNEVGALKPFLTEVICQGRVITADAAQSYHEFPRLVKRAGGEVILIIKDNTPSATTLISNCFLKIRRQIAGPGNPRPKSKRVMVAWNVDRSSRALISMGYSFTIGERLDKCFAYNVNERSKRNTAAKSVMG
jgi:hypothetical protein